MTELQRLRKILQWLSLCGFGDDDKALSKLLEYNHTSFSQIINGSVPLSDSFIKRLQKLDQNINILWIREEKGAMLKSLDSLQQFRIIEEKSIESTGENYKSLYEEKEKEILRLTEMNKLMVSEWGLSIRKQWGREKENKKTG